MYITYSTTVPRSAHCPVDEEQYPLFPFPLSVILYAIRWVLGPGSATGWELGIDREGVLFFSLHEEKKVKKRTDEFLLVMGKMSLFLKM